MQQRKQKKQRRGAGRVSGVEVGGYGRALPWSHQKHLRPTLCWALEGQRQETTGKVLALLERSFSAAETVIK